MVRGGTVILMCIAIEGDNEQLAETQLREAVQHLRKERLRTRHFTVYRAWTRRVSDRSTIDTVLDVDVPHEVKQL